MTSMRILQPCKIPIVTKHGIRMRGDAPTRACAEIAESGCNVVLPQAHGAPAATEKRVA
jgi:hypothetical protein